MRKLILSTIVAVAIMSAAGIAHATSVTEELNTAAAAQASGPEAADVQEKLVAAKLAAAKADADAKAAKKAAEKTARIKSECRRLTGEAFAQYVMGGENNGIRSAAWSSQSAAEAIMAHAVCGLIESGSTIEGEAYLSALSHR